MNPTTENQKDNNFILDAMKNCIENEQLYIKLYKQLYEDVAKMLVENKNHNYNAIQLLEKWDIIRAKK